jgi:hypothetical protein
LEEELENLNLRPPRESALQTELEEARPVEEELNEIPSTPHGASCAANNGFHNFKNPKDKDYINGLFEESHAADESTADEKGIVGSSLRGLMLTWIGLGKIQRR